MSLLSALNTGTAGLEMNSLELSVVGDNIANANTIGFKSGRAAFEDSLMQQMIGAPGGGQLGLGGRLQAIQRMITQGAISNTGMATDLALQGKGYFVLKGNHDGIQGTFFSRAGQFTVDKAGYLVNLDGLRVQGYPANARGVVQATLGDLPIGNASSAAVPSTSITVKANLNSDAVVNPAAFDPLNASATSNFSSSVTIYDSLGKAHTVDIFYKKTAAGAWDFHALTDGSGVTGGTAGTPVEIASGTLAFDTQGRLTAVTQVSNFNPVGAVAPQPMTFNFGDPTATGGTGLAGVTQFASPSATTFTSQDGSGYGSLTSIQINNKGEVMGAFTNGTSKVLGQVAVGDFAADDKLRLIGGNLLLESSDSGQPTIGSPAEGGRAAITSGALEQSNVDIANEFVRMIAAQRGFQANSKTISTADQLLQELMQLKR